jgi:7-carboxy-7-deazaguanine synthase
MTQKLQITEIYLSVQGESSFAGRPCVFVRTTGCPLRCRWCDTVYSFEGGQAYSEADLMKEIASYGVSLVELTGGEPLAQKGCYDLANKLIGEGFEVLIETSGAEDLTGLDEKITVIMDIKCPGSKMEHKNRWQNLLLIKPHHEVKFVISSDDDFHWAVQKIKEHGLEQKAKVLLSPAFGLYEASRLVDLMLEKRLNVRLNLQQHKYIWSPRKRGV